MGYMIPEAGMAPRNVWAQRVRECAPAPYAAATSDAAGEPDPNALDPDSLDELAVHEGGWTVEWWGRHRHLVFVDPRGQAHGSLRRPPPLPADPVETLVARNRARGAQPDADTAPGRWQRERDIPDDVLFRALEATAPG